MSEHDRAERRRRRKALVAAGQRHLRAGLQKRAPRDVLAVTSLALADGTKSPADLAVAQHAGFEVSARVAAPTTQIACRKGCAFCCQSGPVLVSAPEAFALARAARAKGPTYLIEFRARARLVAGKSTAERFGKKLACPFLVGGACSAYGDRPLNCRQTTSYAVEPCREEYEGVGGDISMPAHYLLHAENFRIAEGAALISLGKPVAFYELGEAVLRALETPDTEARWMAGEPVFDKMVSDDEAVAAGVATEAGLAASMAAKTIDGPVGG